MQVVEQDDDAGDVMRDERWRDACCRSRVEWSERRSLSLTDGIIAGDMCGPVCECVCGRHDSGHVHSHTDRRSINHAEPPRYESQIPVYTPARPGSARPSSAVSRNMSCD